MSGLLFAEVTSGLIALLLTATAFAELSWGEGASEETMKLQCLKKARRLFWLAGLFWAGAIACFLFMH